MERQNKMTVRLVLSGILIALATLLSMVKIFKGPFGGSITLFSMAPIFVLGYRYKWKWGILCGVVYGILRIAAGQLTGSSAFAFLNIWEVMTVAALDYLVAYTVIGFSGIFKDKIKNHTVSLLSGSFFAWLLCFVSRIISGCIVYGSYADWFFKDEFVNGFSTYILNNFPVNAITLIYSVIYNGSYMVPDMVIALIALVVIMQIKPLRKEICQ